VPDALEAAVRERVQHLGLNGLALAATHTHASPGGYWNNVFGEHVGTAPFDPRMQEVIVAGVADAIGRAVAALGPAELAVGRRRVDGLVRNRSGGPVEGRLLVARLSRPGGEPVAEVAVFAAHPTTLGRDNHRISGDWPGRFVRSGDRGMRLLLQGAIGDQSVRLPGDEPATPEQYAEALAREVEATRLEAVPQAGFAFATADVVLPAPSPGALPPLLRSAARNLAYESLPDTARVFAVRIGPATLALVPAEPVAEVAEAWRAEAGADVEIVSLAGGYVGYVESPAVMEERKGESVRTYYGPELAARLARGIDAAAKGLAGDAL
jgi:hypothetical protein